MSKSIFEIGITKKRDITELNKLLVEGIKYVMSVSYLSKSLNSTSEILFDSTWDDLIILSVLDKEISAYSKIKISGIRKVVGDATSFKSGSAYTAKEHFENKTDFLQTLELIYNIITIANFVDNLQSFQTDKSKHIIRILNFIKEIVLFIGHEFIVLDPDKKKQVLSQISEPEVIAYKKPECDFYKLVKMISTDKKKIISKVKYISLFEEYNTSASITLERKREILKLLSEIVDDKAEYVKKIFGPKVKDKIFSVLNNYNIRHDNKNRSSSHYNKKFDNMGNGDIEKSYDEIFILIIAFWVVQGKNNEHKK